MQAGERISANVELVRPLGEGGMGAVWVARHTSLGIDVAVKFIAKELATNPAFVARFQREASAAAKVKSPHIVQVFDHGATADGTPFIVMELLEGEELAAKLDRVGRLSVPEVVQTVRQLAKALAKAHQAGIIHRDLKPANVFLVGSDEPEIFAKILDFGIARERSPELSLVTDTGVVLGTPYYMSPEQFMNAKNVDLCADLWSLAVMTYECLTGELPFMGESYGEMVLRVNEAKYTPPRHINPGLPAGLDAWFAKAFARDKQERFQSAREMADALLSAIPRDQHSLRPGAPLSVESTGEFPVVIVPPAATTPRAAAQGETVNIHAGTVAGTGSGATPSESKVTVVERRGSASIGAHATSEVQAGSSSTGTPSRRLFRVVGIGVVAVGLVAFAVGIRSSSSSGTGPAATGAQQSSAPSALAAPTSSAQPAPSTSLAAATSVPPAASAPSAQSSAPATMTASPGTSAPASAVAAKPAPRQTAPAQPAASAPRTPEAAPKDRGF